MPGGGAGCQGEAARTLPSPQHHSVVLAGTRVRIDRGAWNNIVFASGVLRTTDVLSPSRGRCVFLGGTVYRYGPFCTHPSRNVKPRAALRNFAAVCLSGALRLSRQEVSKTRRPASDSSDLVVTRDVAEPRAVALARRSRPLVHCDTPTYA